MDNPEINMTLYCNRYEDGSRRLDARPWVIQAGEKRFRIATNGWMLLALETTAEVDAPPPNSGKEIPEWLTVPLQNAVSVEIAPLKAWAGEPTWEWCRHCKATGAAGSVNCDHTETVQCDQCYEDHECRVRKQDCDKCEGTGKIPCPDHTPGDAPTREGYLGDAFINREFVARTLEYFETGIVRISFSGDQKKPLVIDGDGWRALIMTMKPARDPQDPNRTPRFELPPVAEAAKS